jgi:hypothetical protein
LVRSSPALRSSCRLPRAPTPPAQPQPAIADAAGAHRQERRNRVEDVR